MSLKVSIIVFFTQLVLCFTLLLFQLVSGENLSPLPCMRLIKLRCLSSGVSPFEKLFLMQISPSFVPVLSNYHLTNGPNFHPIPLSFVFLGYGIKRKGYGYYDPRVNHLCISRLVTFLEYLSYFSFPASCLLEQPPLFPIDPFS